MSKDGNYIHRSPRPPIDNQIPLNSQNVSMVDFLLVRTRPFSNQSALIDAASGRSLTFEELHSSIRRVSRNLIARHGIKKRDVILIFAPNSINFMVAFLGIVDSGAIATTVNPHYTIYELRKQVDDCGATLVFTVPGLWDKVRDLNLPTIMLSTGNMRDAADASVPLTQFTDLLEEAFENPPIPDQCDNLGVTLRNNLNDDNDDKDGVTAALIYSSGTTGVNKGVVLTHMNFISSSVMVMMEQDARGEAPNVWLCFLPMFHISGLCNIAFTSLCMGNTLVVMAKFDMEQMFMLVERYKVNNIFMAPPIMIALAKQGKVTRFDLSSLGRFISGAAPLAKDIIDEVASLYPDVKVIQGYGLTESCGIISLVNPLMGVIPNGSTGTLVSGVEGKVIHTDTFKPLPPHQLVELCFRGPNIMPGYFNNMEATTITLDLEGWLHTGDLGYFDNEGRLYIVDKIKELIKYKGFQVAPAELEGLLLSHPEILDAVVVPLPDDQAGEVPIAYVVRSAQSSLTEKIVQKFITQQVSPFKRLHKVSFVTSVPKSPSGKILRRQIIQKLRSKF